MPRGHRVFNKLTPPIGVRDIGSCQPLLCHSCVIHFGYSLGEEVVFSSSILSKVRGQFVLVAWS